MRLDTEGLLDPTFGVVTTDVRGTGSADEATAVALRADGKLVVSGFSGTSIALVPYNSDGSLLCTEAPFTNLVPGGITNSADVAVQPDGKVAVAGTVNPGNSNYVVARYAGSICGNGTTEAGEQCDEGAANGGVNSCCESTCQYKPNGNASCDGNACTRPDTCTDGTCTPGTCADGLACTICGGTCVDTGSACECE